MTKLFIDLFDGKIYDERILFTREFFSNQTSTIYQFKKVLQCAAHIFLICTFDFASI